MDMTVSERFELLQVIKQELACIENSVEAGAETRDNIFHLLGALSKHDSMVHGTEVNYYLGLGEQ